MKLCEHGKRPASDTDLAAYSSRPSCVRAGDCQCHTCSRVCWCCIEGKPGSRDLADGLSGVDR